MLFFSVRAKALACVMAAAAVATFVSLGCDDHDDGDHSHTGGGHESAYPSCKAVSGACHEVDVGEGRIHECHEIAHSAKSDDDCAAVKDECLQVCEAASADAGASSDAEPSSDGGGHAGH